MSKGDVEYCAEAKNLITTSKDLPRKASNQTAASSSASFMLLTITVGQILLFYVFLISVYSKDFWRCQCIFCHWFWFSLMPFLRKSMWKLINTSCPNRMEKANQTKFVFFLSLVFPLSLITSTNLRGSLLQKDVSATCWKQFSHIVIAMVTADFDRNWVFSNWFLAEIQSYHTIWLDG